MKVDLLKSLLMNITASLKNMDEWSILDEGLQALECNAAWLGIDVSLMINHVALFREGMAQLSEARHFRVDPSVEERRCHLQSLLPKLELCEADVTVMRRDWQDAAIGHQGATDRLAEIDDEIARLQAERSVVHLNLSKFGNQKARLQLSIEKREAERNAMRSQVEELRESLQSVPDPAQVLAAAEATQRATQESAIYLLEQCLRNLNS